MPNRIIKESIYLSESLAKVSFEAASHFLWLLPLPDDFGCCHLTSTVVKGRLYPLRDDVSTKDIEKWHAELEKVDLIRSWTAGGHIFGYFPTWSKHQRIRSQHQRKTPEPPSIVVNRCQLTSNDGLNLNLNPNLNPPLTPQRGGASSNILLSADRRAWLNITDSIKTDWGKAYPAVDVDIELARMAAWVQANPNKAKKNWVRFINNWLSRVQDKGGTKGVVKSTTPKPTKWVGPNGEVLDESTDAAY